MIKNYNQFLLGVLVGLVIGIFISKSFLISTPAGSSPVQTEIPTDPGLTSSPEVAPAKNPVRTNSKIPSKVFTVLEYIKDHHKAMNNYVGGRVFSNREKLLPQRDEQDKVITYQEWDVNPKIQRQSRDAERIVTGSDGRSWYTRDHYKSFTEIK